MILDRQFNERKSDVEAPFRFLSFIDGIESHKSIPVEYFLNKQKLIVDQQMQCCVKGLTLVLLYNIVESTVCECLNFIYDAVADDGLTYAELTDEMRKMWTQSCNRGGRVEGKLDEINKMPLKVVFKELATNTSGNIDIRKVYEIFEKHGCMISDNKREECSSSFLIVKNKRNLLAHGNVSFSQCGSAYLYKELEKMRQDIVCFLAIVIDATKKFVANRKYKR